MKHGCFFFLNDLGITETQRPSILDCIDKSERRKPEQTIEDLEKIVPDRGSNIFDQIQIIKSIQSLEDLQKRLFTCGEEGKKEPMSGIH